MLEAAAQKLPSAIADFVNGYSIEITRRGYEKNPSLLATLPQGTQVFLPFLPGSQFEDLIPFAEAVSKAGLIPVPHIAARRLESKSQLTGVLSELTERGGVRQVLCIAGDPDVAAGPFSSSMDILETGLLETNGISQIFLAGHPEGNPAIADTEIWNALRWKNAYAAQSTASCALVTQFSLDPKSLIEWETALIDNGNQLPVRLGVPGPTKLMTLIKYAQACGIGASARMLMKYGSNVTKLAASRAPDPIVKALADHKAAKPQSLFQGLHVYTFGGAAGAIDWLEAVRHDHFRMNAKGDGFEVLV